MIVKTKEYVRKINQILDDIYFEADLLNLTMYDLAAMSKLSYATVIRIKNRKTDFPHFRTVYQLAKSVGFTLNLERISKMRKVG